MANPVKGEVAFEADDKSYTLVFDFNAICELEDEFDTEIEKIGEVIGSRASAIRRVIRVGLSRHHPDIDERQAGDIITAIGPSEAGALITKAFQAAFPEAVQNDSRPTKPRTDGAAH